VCECADRTSRVSNVATGLRLVVSFTSRLLYPPPRESDPITSWPGGWVGFRAGLDDGQNRECSPTVRMCEWLDNKRTWMLWQLTQISAKQARTDKVSKYRTVNLLATEAQYLLSRSLFCMYAYVDHTITRTWHFLSSFFPLLPFSPSIPFCLLHYFPRIYLFFLSYFMNSSCLSSVRSIPREVSSTFQ